MKLWQLNFYKKDHSDSNFKAHFSELEVPIPSDPIKGT